MEINGCPKFGWNFDSEHPMCKQCKRATRCLSLSAQDIRKQKIGAKPRIPYVHEKSGSTPPIQASSATIQNGKVQITLTFDLAWLRKHAESEHETDNP